MSLESGALRLRARLRRVVPLTLLINTKAGNANALFNSETPLIPLGRQMLPLVNYFMKMPGSRVGGE